MMSSFTILTSLSQLSEEDKQKGIKLILKIFDNIINHPHNLRYQNLNLSVIMRKLQKSKTFIDLLCEVGFKKSNDGKTLLFDMKLFNNLHMFKKQLLLTSTKNDDSYSDQKQDTHDCFDIPQCDGNTSSCEWLNKLRNIMILYGSNKLIIDEINIGHILDYFLHAISKHHTSEEFEFIYESFGGSCDLNKCKYFKRNYRNRSKNNQSIIHKDTCIFKVQILDKIHC
eukprot:497270_1